MNEKRTYIVTGCTGFVGNVLTKKLQREGARVIGLARSERKVRRVFGDGAPEIVYGDVTDAGAIEALFCGDAPFTVLHTAAVVSIGEADSACLHGVTVGGTRAVVDACLAHGAKLLQISSTEAMGGVFGEDVPYVPDPARCDTDYARAKAEADAIVLHAVKQDGLDASILLLSSVLGPGDYSHSHMTQMMIDFIEGRLPASVDAGYNDFDIRDVADVLPAIVEKSKKGESYLFANHPDKINDILSVISSITERKLPPTLPLWVAYVGLPFLYIGNKIQKKRPLYTSASLATLRADTNFPIGKAQKEFGYSPRPLEETVRDHVEFLIQNHMVQL